MDPTGFRQLIITGLQTPIALLAMRRLWLPSITDTVFVFMHVLQVIASWSSLGCSQ
jgi:hypothetical protein